MNLFSRRSHFLLASLYYLMNLFYRMSYFLLASLNYIQMSSVGSEDSSSVATEEMSSVAKEHMSSVEMCENWVVPRPEWGRHGSPRAHTF